MTNLSAFKVYLDLACLGGDYILIEVKQYREYQDGKATDKVLGYKYSVVLPHHNFEHLDVKIAGEKRLELAPGTNCNVEFDGLVVKPYLNRTSNQIAFTASASGIRQVQAKRWEPHFDPPGSMDGARMIASRSYGPALPPQGCRKDLENRVLRVKSASKPPKTAISGGPGAASWPPN